MIEITIVNHTPDPEITVAIAARTCFGDESYAAIRERLKDDEVERIIKTVISKNHLGVLEHVEFTFSISGVSRVLTHQLVRHRIASFSQLSQQRSDSSEIEFTIPPDIKKFNDLAKDYEDTVKRCRELYKRIIDCGISRGAARYILPSSANTRIMATMNARSLFNMLSQRECQVEEWEFRQVARLIHNELMKVAPLIFRYAGPPCQTQGHCPEGRDILDCGGYFGASVIEEHKKTDSSLSELII